MTKSDVTSASYRIAYFISPHGYGHAARSAAIMTAVRELDPQVQFEIFTKVPRWFFEQSLPGAFGYHSLLTDIGLAQTTPLLEDLPKTVRRLEKLLPFEASQTSKLADLMHRLECRLVICDIAPMGIAVARQAGIPSLLIENFTWDWIYQSYVPEAPDLSRYIPYLHELFAAADYHVQTEPAHRWRQPDLITLPVSRKIRTPAQNIRRRLGIPDQAQIIMITMGGIPGRYEFLERLPSQDDLYYVIPGADQEARRRLTLGNPGAQHTGGNFVLLPHHSDFFHPDLINASDAVLGKAGYSTLAEVYYAGVPFAYISRSKFRESAVLRTYIEQHMHGLPVSDAQFHNGQWAPMIEQLLAAPRLLRAGVHGADQAARFIYDLLKPRNSNIV
jgi:UDP:flavonoid glycosyltransferase YjiC (YdhE family)